MIVDIEDGSVVEFSNAIPPYELITEIETGNAIYIYDNCFPKIDCEGKIYNVASDGSIMFYKDLTKLNYTPNRQGDSNCIVCAIGNLMWHYGNNGYPSLISGMEFSDVKTKIDEIIMNEGGYANNNIPETISKYVKGRNSGYSVSVTNKWYPSYKDVKKEVAKRP